MTKREMFNAIREEVIANPEMVAFIDRQIELLDKRKSASRKPTKTQVENEGFRADILEYLTAVDAPKAIKELQQEIPSISELTNQRITHLLTALVKDGKVTREVVKRVPYFTITH